MYVFKTVSVLLIGLLQFSVCTGGLLSATNAFAVQITMSNKLTPIASSAALQPLLCANSTPIALQSTELLEFQVPVVQTGCNKQDTCLKQLGINSNDRLLKKELIAHNVQPSYHLKSTEQQNVIPVKQKQQFMPLYFDQTMIKIE